jgi:hypothetical protein
MKTRKMHRRQPEAAHSHQNTTAQMATAGTVKPNKQIHSNLSHG